MIINQREQYERWNLKPTTGEIMDSFTELFGEQIKKYETEYNIPPLIKKVDLTEEAIEKIAEAVVRKLNEHS